MLGHGGRATAFERVDVLADGLELRLKAAGLASLVAELRPHNRKHAA